MTGLGRAFGIVLVALALVSPLRAEARVDRRQADWVSMVVTKVAQADERSASPKAGGGTVMIRIRIASDGTVADVAVEEGSTSQALDERAIRAVLAAAPFKPPPKRLLTLEGYTELSFALDLAGASPN